MAKVIDLSTLGMRREMVRVFKPVADPVTGLRQFQFTTEERDVPNNVLTLEEARSLEDEDWKFNDVFGRFMCIAAGRRFFCDEDPTKPKEKKGAKPK